MNFFIIQLFVWSLIIDECVSVTCECNNSICGRYGYCRTYGAGCCTRSRDPNGRVIKGCGSCTMNVTVTAGELVTNENYVWSCTHQMCNSELALDSCSFNKSVQQPASCHCDPYSMGHSTLAVNRDISTLCVNGQCSFDAIRYQFGSDWKSDWDKSRVCVTKWTNSGKSPASWCDVRQVKEQISVKGDLDWNLTLVCQDGNNCNDPQAYSNLRNGQCWNKPPSSLWDEKVYESMQPVPTIVNDSPPEQIGNSDWKSGMEVDIDPNENLISSGKESSSSVSSSQDNQGAQEQDRTFRVSDRINQEYTASVNIPNSSNSNSVTEIAKGNPSKQTLEANSLTETSSEQEITEIEAVKEENSFQHHEFLQENPSTQIISLQKSAKKNETADLATERGQLVVNAISGSDQSINFDGTAEEHENSATSREMFTAHEGNKYEYPGANTTEQSLVIQGRAETTAPGNEHSDSVDFETDHIGDPENNSTAENVLNESINNSGSNTISKKIEGNNSFEDYFKENEITADRNDLIDVSAGHAGGNEFVGNTATNEEPTENKAPLVISYNNLNGGQPGFISSSEMDGDANGDQPGLKSSSRINNGANGEQPSFISSSGMNNGANRDQTELISSSEMDGGANGEHPGFISSSEMDGGANGEQLGFISSSEIDGGANGEQPGFISSSRINNGANGEQPSFISSSGMNNGANRDQPGFNSSSEMDGGANGEHPGFISSSEMDGGANGEHPGFISSSEMDSGANGEHPGFISSSEIDGGANGEQPGFISSSEIDGGANGEQPRFISSSRINNGANGEQPSFISSSGMNNGANRDQPGFISSSEMDGGANGKHPGFISSSEMDRSANWEQPGFISSSDMDLRSIGEQPGFISSSEMDGGANGEHHGFISSSEIDGGANGEQPGLISSSKINNDANGEQPSFISSSGMNNGANRDQPGFISSSEIDGGANGEHPGFISSSEMDRRSNGEQPGFISSSEMDGGANGEQPGLISSSRINNGANREQPSFISSSGMNNGANRDQPGFISLSEMDSGANGEHPGFISSSEMDGGANGEHPVFISSSEMDGGANGAHSGFISSSEMDAAANGEYSDWSTGFNVNSGRNADTLDHNIQENDEDLGLLNATLNTADEINVAWNKYQAIKNANKSEQVGEFDFEPGPEISSQGEDAVFAPDPDFDINRAGLSNSIDNSKISNEKVNGSFDGLYLYSQEVNSNIDHPNSEDNGVKTITEGDKPEIKSDTKSKSIDQGFAEFNTNVLASHSKSTPIGNAHHTNNDGTDSPIKQTMGETNISLSEGNITPKESPYNASISEKHSPSRSYDLEESNQWTGKENIVAWVNQNHSNEHNPEIYQTSSFSGDPEDMHSAGAGLNNAGNGVQDNLVETSTVKESVNPGETSEIIENIIIPEPHVSKTWSSQLITLLVVIGSLITIVAILFVLLIYTRYRKKRQTYLVADSPSTIHTSADERI